MVKNNHSCGTYCADQYVIIQTACYILNLTAKRERKADFSTKWNTLLC